jgi:cytochrome P450
MSVVCSTIYNIDAHAFTSSKEQSIVKQKVDELLNVGFRFTLHHIITSIYPFLKKYYKVAFCKPEAYPFFYDMMKNAVNYRIDNKIQRVDYLDHLINLYNKKEITIDDITLHGATFLTDGYETSSIAISSALYELGKDKKVQEKLRNEILSAMPKGEDLSYDKIMDLPYLDQVLNEVLRLHIVLMYLPKVCNASTEVDMLDGQKLYFEKDSVIYIPIRSIHLDEAYYEDPLTFKPERFDADRGGVKAYEKKGTKVFF